MDFEDELKRGILAGRIFKRDGEKTLERTYIPEKMRHRDDILNKLAIDFSIVFKENKGINVAIKGGGGFGKTATARFAQKKMVKVASDLNITFDTRYYTCFQFRTLGAMIRDYMTPNYYITGKGFSIAELFAFLIHNLKRDNRKLLLVIDEVQILKPEEILCLLSVNEDTKASEETDEYLSTILIARTQDWDNILATEPRIAYRLQSTVELAKYTVEQLTDILGDRRDLAFVNGVLSDENVEYLAEMSEPSGNVYYGIELMHHAGKYAETSDEPEILPEMIRHAAKYVSTEFREPVLADLKYHELLTLLAIARVLRRNSKDNVNKTSTNDAYEEYKLVCEELNGPEFVPHVITVFRKYIIRLSQAHLIKVKMRNLPPKGRRAELHMIDFPAELVESKIEEILENVKPEP
jgi:Cdc6-like AAA superfamily ATPase